MDYRCTFLHFLKHRLKIWSMHAISHWLFSGDNDPECGLTLRHSFLSLSGNPPLEDTDPMTALPGHTHMSFPIVWVLMGKQQGQSDSFLSLIQVLWQGRSLCYVVPTLSPTGISQRVISRPMYLRASMPPSSLPCCRDLERPLCYMAQLQHGRGSPSYSRL